MPHLRDGFIVAKVGIARKHDRSRALPTPVSGYLTEGAIYRRSLTAHCTTLGSVTVDVIVPKLP